MDFRITKIRKKNRYSDHEHITHVMIDGQIYPREDVIHDIDKKLATFYVYDEARRKRADVRVRRPIGRDPYIQTYADNDWNDNLLSLPEC